MPTLIAASITPQDPLVIAGWAKPAGSVNTRVLSANGEQLIGRSSAGTAIFYNTVALSAPVIRFGFRLPTNAANVTGVKGACLINSSFNGYAITHNGGNAGTIELRTVAAGVLSGSTLASVAATTGVFNDTFYVDRNTATGEMLVYQAPEGIAPALKLTHTDNTIANTNLGGTCITDGRLTEFFSSAIGGAVTTLNPVTMGASGSATTTGFSTITSITSGGLSASNVVFNAGAVSFNWPDFADGQVITTALPAANTDFVFSDGVNPATRAAPWNLPADFINTEFGTTITSDDKYLGYHVTLTSTDRAYWDEVQPGVGTIKIYPDGRVDVNNAGTFVMFLHKIGGDNSILQLNVTVTESGSIVVASGLTSAGLTSIGLTSAGLTSVGL